MGLSGIWCLLPCRWVLGSFGLCLMLGDCWCCGGNKKERGWDGRGGVFIGKLSGGDRVMVVGFYAVVALFPRVIVL
jgi:hypothetical protein